MNELPSPEPYIQHLLPMEIIENHTLPEISPFMNRYIVSTLDHDVIGSKESAYIYSKLGTLLLFGEILESLGHEWKGTQIAIGEGKLRIEKYAIPKRIWTFINDRANFVANISSQISPKQQEVIESSRQKDLKKLASSKLAQAMKADIQFCGEEAFEVTKSKDLKSE